MRGDWTRFSTPRTTPSGVLMPTVVEPSYKGEDYVGVSVDRFDAYFNCLDGIFDWRKALAAVCN